MMIVQSEIIGYLESIFGIYLSDIRQKERATYILCDHLVEICCKTRILERNKQNQKRRNFHEALKDAKVPKSLIKELAKRHDIRNDMQHVKLGITIDNQDCADAIIGLIKLIKKLWGKYALSMAPDWILCAQRIVELYTSYSNSSIRVRFEKKVLKEIDWSKNVNEGNISDKRLPNKNEIIIEVGAKNYWALLVREKTSIVMECLDEVVEISI
jgi:hypothetical protein